MYNAFQEIEKLAGVESAGSDVNENPLHDESVTIYLKNGYRLISTKSLLGQTIELDPFSDTLDSSTPSFKAELYHKIETPFHYQPKNEIYKLHNNLRRRISLEKFIEQVNAIISQELNEFLKQRHESVPFRVIHPPIGL